MPKKNVVQAVMLWSTSAFCVSVDLWVACGSTAGLRCYMAPLCFPLTSIFPSGVLAPVSAARATTLLLLEHKPLFLHTLHSFLCFRVWGQLECDLRQEILDTLWSEQRCDVHLFLACSRSKREEPLTVSTKGVLPSWSRRSRCKW